MDKTYKQHGKFFKYLTKMLWQARVLPAKTALPKCLLLGFGIFWIGVTIAVKVLCRKLTFEDVWVSI
jgi:hypothetical protein